MNNNKRLFAKNSITGVVQKILIAILTFVTIPIFIKLLGAELFGIFAIVSTIGDLSRLTNVGFHIALIKFLSRQGKTTESSQDVVVAFLSMLVIMTLLVMVLLLFSDFILLQLFNVGMEHFAAGKFLFYCLVFANAFLFIGMPFSATLESLRLIYKVSIMQFVYSVIYWSLILLFVSVGGGLEWVGVAVLTAAVVWFVMTVWLARKAWGRFESRGIRAYFMLSVKKQLGYGLKVYLSGLLGLFTEPLIKVLIANFFGVTYVGFVDIGLRIRNQFTRILKAAVWPLFQYFSELSDKEKAAFLVKDVQEKLIIAFIPVSVILLFASHALVTLWIGENVDVITQTIIVITIGSLIGQLALEPIGIYLGVHHPMRLFYNQIFMIVAITLPVLLLHERFGFFSVYAGFILSYLASIIHMMFCEKFYLGNIVFSESRKLSTLSVYLFVLFAVGNLLSILHLSPEISLIIIPAALSILAFVLIKEQKLIQKSDIYYYLEKDHVIARKLASLFK